MSKMRIKYLDFKLTKGEWDKQKPFLAINLNAVKNGEAKQIHALMKWTPMAFKSKYRIRLINKRTKEVLSYPVKEVKYIERWLIVVLDVTEVFDMIMRQVPSIVATGVVLGAVTSALKKQEEKSICKEG